MGLAHEKKSYLQEKANLFEIGSLKRETQRRMAGHEKNRSSRNFGLGTDCLGQ